MADSSQTTNRTPPELPVLSIRDRWDEVLADSRRTEFGACLGAYIRPQRWFGGKTREIKTVHVAASLAIPAAGDLAYLLVLNTGYAEGESEAYQLAIAFGSGPFAENLCSSAPHLVIARVQSESGGPGGILYDASASAGFAKAMFDCIANAASIPCDTGLIEGFDLPAMKRIRGDANAPLEPRTNVAEQSNSAILFGDKFILKTFRRLEPGTNPDLEIGRHLSKRNFPHTAALAGGIEFRAHDGAVMSLGILSEFFPNCTDGWHFTLGALDRYFESVDSPSREKIDTSSTVGALLRDAMNPVPGDVGQCIGGYLESARLLGDRTAALHLCLASDDNDPAFAPEPFQPAYQRSLFESFRSQTQEAIATLRRSLPTLPGDARDSAEKVVDLENEIFARLEAINERKITARRLRVHGDYHLGQVLHTGQDFLIIDFEGEPARPMAERRAKHSPLKDVAGMLRSFDYAAHAALYNRLEQGCIDAGRMAHLEPRARFWTHWVSVVFLEAYLARARGGGFLPTEARELEILLEASLLDKAAYELCYELNNRPAWLKIPLKGILQLMNR